MKFKLIALMFSLILRALLLSGCGKDEHPSGLLGEESNFNFNLLSRLFEPFPNAFPILRYVLNDY